MQDFGDAFDDMLKNQRWKNKYHRANLREDWEKLFGPVISKYTQDLQIIRAKLHITVSSAAMRQELFNERSQILKKVNEYYGEELIKEIVLK